MGWLGDVFGNIGDFLFRVLLNPDSLIIGLQLGAVYSLVALGLALVFKATKVLNFAHGEIGTSAAFLAFVLMFYVLRPLGVGNADALDGTQLLIATVPAIAFGALLGIGVSLFLRRLANATPVTNLVATVGIALLLVSLQLVIFEAEGKRFPRYVEGNAFQFGDGIPISWHTLIVLAILGGAATLLALFFKTPPGVALLATSQDPYAAELQGISVRSIGAIAWGTAGALGAIAGLLGAGVYNQLSPGLMLSIFLIPAFTGAVLGGLTSMPGAVLGGLVLGLLVATANQANLFYDLGLSGPPQIAVFGALLLVLLIRPAGLLGARGT